MRPEVTRLATRIAAAVGLLVLVSLVTCVAYQTLSEDFRRDAAAYEHPSVESSQTCVSCKEPRHDYVHEAPYAEGTCERCHTTRSWGDVSYTHPREEFNQSLHAVLGCSWCHTEGGPNPSSACATCHADDSPHGAVVAACDVCHIAVAWQMRKPLPGGHLVLTGGHEGLSCLDCHSASQEPGATARKCVDCHGKQHGGLTGCERCHDPARGWEPYPGFDHAAFFGLIGAHRLIPCASCHPGGRFAGTSSDCVDCHGSHHGGLTRCSQCHSPVTGWRALPGFDHDAFFPLTGAHTRVACGRCHTTRFAGTPTYCSGCHRVVHTGLTKCQNCHTTSRFAPSTFDHSRYFRLRGAHLSLACSSCHRRGVYNGTPTWCSGCHGTRHGGLTACGSCHTNTAFRPATFVHSSVFALTGAHASLKCDKCHPGNRYATNISGGGSACAGCHTGPHGACYTSCAGCHTTTAWSPAKAITHPGYIRLGAEHSSRSCRLCHPTLVFSASPTPCQQSGCHASTVPHVGPTVCLDCHRPTTWSELHFTHTDLGIHEGTNLNQQCLWCHPGPDYTKWDCKTCHDENGIPWSEPAP